MTVTSESQQGRFHTYFYAAAVLILWIATHGFVGVRHDAQFYVFQAMARLDPATFSSDLFLRYGSQDQFSVFGGLFASVLSFVGIEPAYILLLGGSQILWLVGALFLVRGIFSSARFQVAALVAILLLPPFYGWSPVFFRYAEPYLTPRLIAEGFSLFALGFAFRKAWRRALLCLGGAFVLHPLMALPIGGIVFLLALPETKKVWALLPVGVVAVFGLALAGVDPFSHVFRFFSEDWWQVIVQRNKYGFVSEWDFPDYARLGIQGLIGGLAFAYGTQIERKFLQVVAIVAGGFFFLALVGALWVHNVLFIEAQLYRVGWVLAFVVNMMAGALFLRSFGRKTLPHLCIVVGLGLYGLDHFFPHLLYFAFVLLIAGVFALVREYDLKRVLGKTAHLSLFAVACAGCLSAVGAVFYEGADVVRNPEISIVVWGWLSVLSGGAAVAVYGWRRWIGWGFLIAALGTAILGYDQRSPLERYIWSEEHPSQEFVSTINNAKNVYWEDNVGLLWFNLKHPSYFSFEQGASAIIFKDLALDFSRRCQILSLVHPSDACVRESGDRIVGIDRGEMKKIIEVAHLAEVCRALPDLDVVVLSSDIAGASRVAWTMPVERYLKISNAEGTSYKKENQTYYLYECRDYR